MAQLVECTTGDQMVARLRLTADGVTVVLIYLWMGECHVQIMRVDGSWDDCVLHHPKVIVTLTLTSDLVSGNLHRVWCISPIFCEVEIPNLVFGCILGWRSVVLHFGSL